MMYLLFRSLPTVLSLLFLSLSTALFAQLSLPFVENQTPTIVDGFLTVPLDWHDPQNQQTIQIKYRILQQGNQPLPWLFFVGGGPGMESIPSYQDNPGQFLAQHFRVVLFDQRGTGASTPLDHYAAELTPAIVARFFSARQIIHDLDALIQQLAGAESYILMGHSFGGVLINYYLLSSQLRASPSAVVYLSSPTLLDPNNFIQQRILAQKKASVALPEDLRQMITTLRSQIRDRRKTNHRFFESYLDARVSFLNDPTLLKKDLGLLVQAAGQTEEDFLAALTNHWISLWQTNRFGPVISEINAPYLIKDFGVFQEELQRLELGEGMLTDATMVGELPLMRKALLGPDYHQQVEEVSKQYTAFNQLDPQKLRAVLSPLPVVTFLSAKDLYVPFAKALEEYQELFTQEHHRPLTAEDGDHYSGLYPHYLQSILQSLREVQEKAACNRALTVKPI